MSVRITVHGVTEVQAYFRKLATGIIPQVVDPSTRDHAEALADAMIRREHVASGRMRNSTRSRKINQGYAAVVDVPYAEEENMREGLKKGKKGTGRGTPHRFVEPAMKEVEEGQFQNFLMRLTQFLAS